MGRQNHHGLTQYFKLRHYRASSLAEEFPSPETTRWRNNLFGNVPLPPLHTRRLEIAVSPAAEVQIRQAKASDEKGIRECLSAAFAPYQTKYTPEGFSDTVLDAASLLARMQQMHILVACAQGEIIGTVGGAVGTGGEGHLRGMAVLPAHQATGVATRLLRAIENWLAAQGCTRVTLDTTRPLLTAMKFYEKHGYSQSGRLSDFFGMPLVEYTKTLHRNR